MADGNWHEFAEFHAKIADCITPQEAMRNGISKSKYRRISKNPLDVRIDKGKRNLIANYLWWATQQGHFEREGASLQTSRYRMQPQVKLFEPRKKRGYEGYKISVVARSCLSKDEWTPVTAVLAGLKATIRESDAMAYYNNTFCKKGTGRARLAGEALLEAAYRAMARRSLKDGIRRKFVIQHPEDPNWYKLA